MGFTLPTKSLYRTLPTSNHYDQRISVRQDAIEISYTVPSIDLFKVEYVILNTINVNTNVDVIAIGNNGTSNQHLLRWRFTCQLPTESGAFNQFVNIRNITLENQTFTIKPLNSMQLVNNLI